MQNQVIQPVNGDPFVGMLETPVTSSPLVASFLSNLPAYRTGVSPVLRGVEIGLAHGFLLVGPFIKVGSSIGSNRRVQMQHRGAGGRTRRPPYHTAWEGAGAAFSIRLEQGPFSICSMQRIELQQEDQQQAARREAGQRIIGLIEATRATILAAAASEQITTSGQSSGSSLMIAREPAEGANLGQMTESKWSSSTEGRWRPERSAEGGAAHT